MVVVFMYFDFFLLSYRMFVSPLTFNTLTLTTSSQLPFPLWNLLLYFSLKLYNSLCFCLLLFFCHKVNILVIYIMNYILAMLIKEKRKNYTLSARINYKIKYYPVFCKNPTITAVTVIFIFHFYSTILIDFNKKIIICYAEISYAIFKYFKAIEKYLHEVSILRY